MNMPTKVEVGDGTREALAGLALSDPDLLLEGLEAGPTGSRGAAWIRASFSLVKIAALIALDAPPTSYLWQVANALDAGCTPEDLLGVLKAIAPQVGGPRVVAAAPEIMIAMGLALPEGAE